MSSSGTWTVKSKDEKFLENLEDLLLKFWKFTSQLLRHLTFIFVDFQSDGGLKTYQSVIKAEGADVIGGDVALSERLRDLGHDATLIYKEKLGI